MSQVDDLVVALRAAVKEARRCERERDGLKRESEEWATKARQAWDEVFRLRGAPEQEP